MLVKTSLRSHQDPWSINEKSSASEALPFPPLGRATRLTPDQEQEGQWGGQEGTNGKSKEEEEEEEKEGVSKQGGSQQKQ